MQSPYFYLIQRYFPPDQWEAADCVSVCECSPARQGYPLSCVNPNEWVEDPDGNVYQAASYGIFQILDAVWDPSKNSNSPFTPEQWARVLDPNVNTWMASVIWSRSGWIAWPGTHSGCCLQCGVCDVQGGAIPCPDGPIEEPPPEQPILVSMLPSLLLGSAMIAIGVSIFRQARRSP